METDKQLNQEVLKFGRDLHNEGVDITGYSESNLRYLLRISKMCAKQSGIPVGAATGIVGAKIGGTITLGTLTLPTFVAGFLAGFVGGTATCVIGRGAIKPVLDDILKNQPE